MTGAVLTNNLPALLVTLPLVGDRSLWGLLLGVNLGPVLWLSGSLAGLLWADLLRQGGVEVGLGRYARLGLRVGGPALAAAVAVLVAQAALG